MKPSRLTIGITTFNRRSTLQSVADSLAQVNGLERARVWVLDDASTEFDEGFLQRLFPSAAVFRAVENSGGADAAMQRLFQRFVTSGSGHLLVLDADLLASRRLVAECLRIIEAERAGAPPCLFSVFNAPSHAAIADDGEFVLKRSVGAAGTLWAHALLADVLRNVPLSRQFDWDWSAYLTGRGVPIRVTRRSYVQHIGRVGQHSRSFVGMDHGLAFDDYAGHNLSAFLDHIRQGVAQAIEDHQKRHTQLAEAIVQLTEVVQSQARLIGHIIEELGSVNPKRSGPAGQPAAPIDSNGTNAAGKPVWRFRPPDPPHEGPR